MCLGGCGVSQLYLGKGIPEIIHHRAPVRRQRGPVARVAQIRSPRVRRGDGATQVERPREPAKKALRMSLLVHPRHPFRARRARCRPTINAQNAAASQVPSSPCPEVPRIDSQSSPTDATSRYLAAVRGGGLCALVAANSFAEPRPRLLSPGLHPPHLSSLKSGSTAGRSGVLATIQPVAYIQRVMRV